LLAGSRPDKADATAANATKVAPESDLSMLGIITQERNLLVDWSKNSNPSNILLEIHWFKNSSLSNIPTLMIGLKPSTIADPAEGFIGCKNQSAQHALLLLLVEYHIVD
jgi:hypothetical protein